jgi:hypothetical protein
VRIDGISALVTGGPLRAVVHCPGRGGDRYRIIDKDRNPASFVLATRPPEAR